LRVLTVGHLYSLRRNLNLLLGIVIRIMREGAKFKSGSRAFCATMIVARNISSRIDPRLTGDEFIKLAGKHTRAIEVEG